MSGREKCNGFRDDYVVQREIKDQVMIQCDFDEEVINDNTSFW